MNLESGRRGLQRTRAEVQLEVLDPWWDGVDESDWDDPFDAPEDDEDDALLQVAQLVASAYRPFAEAWQ